MKLFPPVLLVLVSLLISPANAQDYKNAQDYIKAFKPYLRGDYASARHKFQRLAERGNVQAQYKLGLMYNNGEGVRQDFREAVMWFSRAAVQGYAPAQTSLGVKYEHGQGVKRSNREAVRWYRHGATQGHATAQYRLGRMYVLGRGARRNYTEAVAWFILAAAQGVEDAATARVAVAARLSPSQISLAELMAREWQKAYSQKISS